uniref:Uncharacterized protein n=1 Tax=Rhizophora mucronata TaxID=61149 RepID=A0A2P2QCJ5_RHIMU
MLPASLHTPSTTAICSQNIFSHHPRKSIEMFSLNYEINWSRSKKLPTASNFERMGTLINQTTSSESLT